MKLLLINGSPRGEKGSTAMLLNAFATGVKKVDNIEINTLTLCRTKSDNEKQNAFLAADIVILAFPLYTDAMPALTKSFIEALAPLRGNCKKQSLGFIVQSGFPEACQSRAIERYNKKLSDRLGCNYVGCVIRGNCNRLEEQPGFVTKPLFKHFENIGKSLGQNGIPDPILLKKLAKPERLGPVTRIIGQMLNLTPLPNLFWDRELKKNNVYKERDRRPYQAI